VAQRFPEVAAAPILDKLAGDIIDHATRAPCLDSSEIQNHLRGQGFSSAPDGQFDGLMARTGSSNLTLPTTGWTQAEKGFCT
jgi:hypothetical protein